MKTILTIIMLFGFCAIYAQNIEPKFEKKGELTEATFYHDNGQIAQQGFFNVNNKLNGIWTSYDLNGKKLAIAEYDNGVKVGKWFFWSKNSLKEVDYNNNTILSVNEWENKSTIADRD